MRIDHGPAARNLAALVAGIEEADLARPTPCTEYSVGDLLDHVAGFPVAFAAAARKEPLELDGPPPVGDAATLAPGWRERIPADLDALVEAWHDPAAWTGMTRAGGVDLPGEVCGLVALGEVVLHGWDLAVATGRPWSVDDAALEALESFLAGFSVPDGVERPFAPAVPVASDAPLLDRVLARAGRDPRWSPPA